MSIKYDSSMDTVNHIFNVQIFINFFVVNLLNRGLTHDQSKLEYPEKEAFDKFKPMIYDIVYDSDEYKKTLNSMKKELKHHYKNNRHHPEFYERGINGMNLIDIIEMFCDWKAASLRNKTGSVQKSIEISCKKFNMSNQLKEIFLNTAEVFEVFTYSNEK